MVLTTNEVLHSGSDKVVIRTTGTAAGTLQIETETVVEYDGMGIVDVVLTPTQPIAIDGVDFRVNVLRQPEQQVLGFATETVYWSGRDRLLAPCYSGSYKSIVGFVSRQFSFWWLADESDGWDRGAQLTTEIHCTPETLELNQPVVVGPRLLSTSVHYRFAFLATPVRELTPDFRSNRVVAGISTAEARAGNVGLWWTDATAHFALPYLGYPDGAREHLTAAEISAYPGAARNAENVQQWRGMGIDRLPYVSLRAISPLDSAAQPHLAEWRSLPAIATGGEVDAPYTTGYKRPLVSLRASGYVDHQLEQLSAIADGLGVRGFYFDQAEPIGSENPAHVAPGSNGLVNPVTDVLAMRDFFKRLATLLYSKGRSPLIYVHNSTAPIIPAYTFVTAMVQGEELNQVATIRNFDYQGSIPMSYVWPMYSPQNSGVPTVWLEELWSEVFAARRPAPYGNDTRGWLESGAFSLAWRNFMAMALLHDIPVWTLAPVAQREALYAQMDRFGVSASDFHGYWEFGTGWPGQPVLLSAYVRPEVPAVLLVAANVTTEAQTLSASTVASWFDAASLPVATREVLARYGASGAQVAIAPRDFTLIELH
ncbi:MAG: hypothetical protein ABI567_01845 [Gammaproteobacteria bacterium]